MSRFSIRTRAALLVAGTATLVGTGVAFAQPFTNRGATGKYSLAAGVVHRDGNANVSSVLQSKGNKGGDGDPLKSQ